MDRRSGEVKKWQSEDNGDAITSQCRNAATPQTIHIINHTHWDREWFLSSIYTTHWIPRLIDRLVEISAENPDFRYLFDGQTLVIEDLLKAYPGYRPKVAQLISNGNLTIGPYYCQPDWKLTCGESLFRNLEYGHKDADALGGTTDVGWLVDTFGHVSQSPQIHAQNGIDAAFVWRGVPLLQPYFDWQGADGTVIFGVDLFGGYRNLYGVTLAPDMAEKRLISEIAKLAPYYPTPDIPLFDGYDLEDNPEDPLTFYTLHAPRTAHQLLEATPRSFVNAIRPKLPTLPTLCGELNSGKYGATFPGTYSARVYSKIMARDCANLLYRWAEPLAVMAWAKGREYEAEKYEAWSRLLLQCDVHDVICGVSIDQVHEKAQDIYQQIFAGIQVDIEKSLRYMLDDFAAGTYAIGANPQAGLGITRHAAQPMQLTVMVEEDGMIRLGGGCVGRLVVSTDHGDTYSDETGEILGCLTPISTATQYNAQCVNLHFQSENLSITANVSFTSNNDSVLKWAIELDSTGTDFRVEFVVDTQLQGRVMAGMPFDVVERPIVDADLMPRELGDKGKIFMGQRELNEVRSFPFHDFVAIDDGTQTAAIFAKGIYAYRAFEDGKIAVTLRRSSEWLTRPNLKNRIGDAGPFFYVPDARCERTVKHELAFVTGNFSADSIELQRLNAAFQNPPLIVEWNGTGTETEWQFLQSDVPISSLRLVDGKPVARFYNPTTQPMENIAPKEIKTVELPIQPISESATVDTAGLQILNYPEWRVGENHGLPDEGEIGRLHEKAAQSQAAKEQAEADLLSATGDARYRFQHRVYVHHREMLEYQLSARLNELKLAQNGNTDQAYLYEQDPLVAKIGWELNQLRIKRRIYDYVVAAL